MGNNNSTLDMNHHVQNRKKKNTSEKVNLHYPDFSNLHIQHLDQAQFHHQHPLNQYQNHDKPRSLAVCRHNPHKANSSYHHNEHQPQKYKRLQMHHHYQQHQPIPNIIAIQNGFLNETGIDIPNCNNKEEFHIAVCNSSTQKEIIQPSSVTLRKQNSSSTLQNSQCSALETDLQQQQTQHTIPHVKVLPEFNPTGAKLRCTTNGSIINSGGTISGRKETIQSTVIPSSVTELSKPKAKIISSLESSSTPPNLHLIDKKSSTLSLSTPLASSQRQRNSISLDQINEASPVPSSCSSLTQIYTSAEFNNQSSFLEEKIIDKTTYGKTLSKLTKNDSLITRRDILEIKQVPYKKQNKNDTTSSTAKETSPDADVNGYIISSQIKCEFDTNHFKSNNDRLNITNNKTHMIMNENDQSTQKRLRKFRTNAETKKMFPNTNTKAAVANLATIPKVSSHLTSSPDNLRKYSTSKETRLRSHMLQLYLPPEKNHPSQYFRREKSFDASLLANYHNSWSKPIIKSISSTQARNIQSFSNNHILSNSYSTNSESQSIESINDSSLTNNEIDLIQQKLHSSNKFYFGMNNKQEHRNNKKDNELMKSKNKIAFKKIIDHEGSLITNISNINNHMKSNYNINKDDLIHNYKTNKQETDIHSLTDTEQTPIYNIPKMENKSNDLNNNRAGVYDDDEKTKFSDIQLNVRPTLPRRQLEVPRFSPIIAWRMLSDVQRLFLLNSSLQQQQASNANDSTNNINYNISFINDQYNFLSTSSISADVGTRAIEEKIQRIFHSPQPMFSDNKSGDSGISAGDVNLIPITVHDRVTNKISHSDPEDGEDENNDIVDEDDDHKIIANSNFLIDSDLIDDNLRAPRSKDKTKMCNNSHLFYKSYKKRIVYDNDHDNSGINDIFRNNLRNNIDVILNNQINKINAKNIVDFDENCSRTIMDDIDVLDGDLENEYRGDTNMYYDDFDDDNIDGGDDDDGNNNGHVFSLSFQPANNEKLELVNENYETDKKSKNSKSNRHRFKFQSTVRQIERKQLADRLSREAEEHEAKRKLEAEAISRVEQEFKRKRIKEKFDLCQRLRLFSFDELPSTNQCSSLPVDFLSQTNPKRITPNSAMHNNESNDCTKINNKLKQEQQSQQRPDIDNAKTSVTNTNTQPQPSSVLNNNDLKNKKSNGSINKDQVLQSKMQNSFNMKTLQLRQRNPKKEEIRHKVKSYNH